MCGFIHWTGEEQHASSVPAHKSVLVFEASLRAIRLMPILWIAKLDGRAVGIPVWNLGDSEFRSRPGDWGGILTTQVPGVVIVGVAAVYLSFSGYQGWTSWDFKLITYLHRVPRLRMSGAPPVCLHTGQFVWDVVDNVSESGFSPSSWFFCIKSHFTSAPPYRLVSEVRIWAH